MRYKFLPVILVLFFGLFATSVLAKEEREVETRRTPVASRSALLFEKPEDHDKDGSAGGKLRACQSKENSVKKRLGQLIRLSVKMLGKFDAITLRIENFYTTKVVPGGKSLPNYDELVADIAAKKVLAQTALTTAQTDSKNFSCSEDDPKGHLNRFRLEMQNVKKALHDYRTSIKNLIVAVHTLVGDTDIPKPSESPEATETP